ncbi:MAG TPA: RNA polymerase sigma factor [Bacteroidales bacterium]|nr:RNA polymerase sigma factor [Bacteroidales bacterium]MBK7733021.1 RNA polymerase sigma factor [Bacteroidales bacterium]MBP7035724.1 RNA polymerase sigma factor [Bacteroidales bacterium]MZQ79591.1 sigma-70 family RNA polymerase sigma factor [Bacteroidales bacterium]HHU99795.1 RNA polymerase sigma factor [Bacteroidales bacterium]
MATPDIHIHDRLIDECREGNRRAQFRLYELYSKAMFNTAYRIMGNREDAEDMLQEAFTDCFRKIGSYRTESTFGAWLKTIVINRCISRLRKREAELVFIDDYSRHEMQQDEPQEMIWPDPSVIARAVERLPDGYRVVFSLYLLEGYDHTEISQILGISESTSKTQYSRAKEKLKKILSEMRRDG